MKTVDVTEVQFFTRQMAIHTLHCMLFTCLLFESTGLPRFSSGFSETANFPAPKKQLQPRIPLLFSRHRRAVGIWSSLSAPSLRLRGGQQSTSQQKEMKHVDQSTVDDILLPALDQQSWAELLNSIHERLDDGFPFALEGAVMSKSIVDIHPTNIPREEMHKIGDKLKVILMRLIEPPQGEEDNGDLESEIIVVEALTSILRFLRTKCMETPKESLTIPWRPIWERLISVHIPSMSTSPNTQRYVLVGKGIADRHAKAFGEFVREARGWFAPQAAQTPRRNFSLWTCCAHGRHMCAGARSGICA